MTIARRANAAALACLVYATAAGAQAGRDDASLKRLEQELTHLATFSGGKLGVGMIHFNS
jgi:hypothetical protein